MDNKNETTSTLDFQLEILKMEITHIQDIINNLDKIMQQIKNWAILTWAGSISLIISNTLLKDNGYIFFTTVIPLFFWFIDGHYRKRQRRFIFRSIKISEFINSEKLNSSFVEDNLIGFIVYDPRGLQYENSVELKQFANIYTMWISKSMRYFYLGIIITSILFG